MTLPELDFSKAKAQLSDVMTAVTQQHQPRVVRRHGGKESMLLVDTHDLAEFLSAFQFEPTVVVDGGEFTIGIDRLGVLGFGATMDEALADLVSELRAYTQRYFAQPSFYVYSDRRGHWPWLLRFALVASDRQLDLIRADMKAVAERRRSESAAHKELATAG